VGGGGVFFFAHFIVRLRIGGCATCSLRINGSGAQ
jgi:hypothetical protein